MDTQADKMLDTFVSQNGTIADWGGDRSEWLTAFGFWCGGWYAYQKSAQHRVQPIADHALVDTCVILESSHD